MRFHIVTAIDGGLRLLPTVIVDGTELSNVGKPVLDVVVLIYPPPAEVVYKSSHVLYLGVSAEWRWFGKIPFKLDPISLESVLTFHSVLPSAICCHTVGANTTFGSNPGDADMYTEPIGYILSKSIFTSGMVIFTISSESITIPPMFLMVSPFTCIVKLWVGNVTSVVSPPVDVIVLN